jgi:hypothetical protein
MNAGIRVLNSNIDTVGFVLVFWPPWEDTGEDDDAGLQGAPKYGGVTGIPHIHRNQ